MRADVAGIEDRDAERRSRRTTRGHAARKQWVTLAALFLNGQAIQPRLGGASQPDALEVVCGLRVSDVEMALRAISIQNRAEVRK